MGLRDWFRGRQPAGPPPNTPSVTPRDQLITSGEAPGVAEPETVTDDEIQDWARALVLPGFRTRDTAVQDLHEMLDLPTTDPRPAVAVDLCWQERRAAETTWTSPDDHTRLRAAFDRLAADGVVARMAFTCCQSCGIAEIEDERTPAHPPGDGEHRWAQWAYVFFHLQDADRLADLPATLRLSYGAFRSAPASLPELATTGGGAVPLVPGTIREADVAAGWLLVRALTDAGLDPDWDGDPTRRVSVRITDWRKPLPTPDQPAD